jgi:hypothetical protein
MGRYVGSIEKSPFTFEEASLTLLPDLTIGREYFASRATKMGIFILAYQPLTTAGVPFDPTYKFVKDRIDSSQSRIQLLFATGKAQYDLLQQMRQASISSANSSPLPLQ